MRRTGNQAILVNATELREELREEHPNIQLHTKGYRDILRWAATVGGRSALGLPQPVTRTHHHLPAPTATLISGQSAYQRAYLMPRRRLRAAITHGGAHNYYWLPKGPRNRVSPTVTSCKLRIVSARGSLAGFHFAAGPGAY
jgi:hypothetical protein